MLIIPPELRQYSTAAYYSDIEYREQVDLENIAERRERLNLLLHPASVLSYLEKYFMVSSWHYIYV